MLFVLGSIGLPGSGKSTFLKRFAHEQRFFYWQNDEARRRIFSSPQHDRSENDILGRAASYSFEQALAAGVSCIYDVNLNQRRHRRSLAQLAQNYGADFVLVWLQIPQAMAEARVAERAQAASGEQRAYYETFRPDVVQYMARRLELPDDGERVVELSGTDPYEHQARELKAALSLG
jgi:predicted kinase